MKQFCSRYFRVASLIGALLLTGCASTFSSKVQTVNQLPETLSDKTFVFQAHPEQSNDLEYTHAAEDIKARLQELGFSQSDASTAHLKVTLQLNTTPGNTHVSSPFGTLNYLVTPSGMVIPIGGISSFRAYTPMFRYPQRFYSRPIIYSRLYSPFYTPFLWGRRYDPFWGPELEIRQSFEHGVEIAISENATGKLLYAVNAKTDQNDPYIESYLPLLVESALRDFPSKSGDARIEIRVEK
ncbi:DUF4136 domain-containing protein [Undibacterium fentianense]|uniref:DUF4136 domain-containing protein n=1 Tax=Undibacterium fentianense TaxID=2828728 RepID=A0A941E440_9BURK|nr:DUF4136 domain-containing protein [Undibacterium fentianense]MBR7799378.1 DUF4136 domain-containing protein [Undibacterium fentianense]